MGWDEAGWREGQGSMARLGCQLRPLGSLCRPLSWPARLPLVRGLWHSCKRISLSGQRALASPTGVLTLARTPHHGCMSHQPRS